MTPPGQRSGPRGDWIGYLDRFHEERAGITEDVLACSTDAGGNDPYDWLLEAVPASQLTLDVACGSAPLSVRRPGPWIGLDRSPTELRLAADRGARILVVADSGTMPFVDAAFDSVVCSMAMMLLQPLEQALTEIRRILASGGRGGLLLPDRHPLDLRDMSRYARLLVALRLPGLGYPNDQTLSRLPETFSTFGLQVTSEERRRFAVQFDNVEDADRFVRSLYLPDVPVERVERAVAVARRWAGSSIGVPLRRVVFHRP